MEPSLADRTVLYRREFLRRSALAAASTLNDTWVQA